MKRSRKIAKILLLSLIMVAPNFLPEVSNTTVAIAEAATPKISQSKLTLEVGKTKTLTIKNNKKSVAWKSSKKTVATVSKKGKVTAKTPGTSIITGTISGKKYTCKVTVKKASNPSLKNAPFDAIEFNLENINMVVPKNWSPEVKTTESGTVSVMVYPNADALSSVEIAFTLNEDKLSFDNFIKEYASMISAEAIEKTITASLGGVPVKITDYKTEDSKTSSFSFKRVTYTVGIKSKKISYTQSLYLFVIGDYCVSINAIDKVNSYANSTIMDQVEYIIDSIRVIK